MTKIAFARPGRIHFLPDAANLYFHRESKPGAKPIEVYRTFPFATTRDYKEIDTDPSRNSVVLATRDVKGAQDQVFWNTAITYSRKGGHDLLSGFRFESFEGKSVRMRHTTSDFQSEVLPAPSESDYHLALSEGQVVTLQVFAKGTAPQVPHIDNSPALYRDGEFVPASVDSEGNVRPLHNSFWVLVVVIVSLTAVVIVAVFVRSRWRRR